MKPIRLFFQPFNANQLFSPVIGEYKATKERIYHWGLSIQSQLKRRPRIPSKLLPCGIHITFYVAKDNFDPVALCILTHKIIKLMELHAIIQDSNNKCIKSITFDWQTIKNIADQGCQITITD